ncbi:uncharacterized protein LOC106754837 [Vigna radiata var. radiata]|uniref:Uncharacterized protein LOC106754837 n=1 Tax=Vigna radiata var. radiata TaxID=3916 RepID=A0A1S3TF52_VIGRR|nr:uncharacterized protein LOC106754837 [Vigna radiata var. radiata]
MEISEDMIAPFNEQIVGFAGERVDTRGYIDLRTHLGSEDGGKELRVRFLLVEANTSYNALLGRPCLNAFGVIVSTPHLAMKFPTDKGNICTVRADERTARQCYVAGLKVTPYRKENRTETILIDLDPRTNTDERIQLEGEIRPFVVGKTEQQTTSIAANLKPFDKNALKELLKNNNDLFAWIMVKKANRQWRMCVDFTDLNKACPKDSYPLPNIDRLVDGASGHTVLSFLDAYSGYNQISMHAPDREKTAFITEHANYCFDVMPFGLKNAGATYQRLMDKVFHNQTGRCMEV